MRKPGQNVARAHTIAARQVSEMIQIAIRHSRFAIRPHADVTP
jgi:hypothetical protein